MNIKVIGLQSPKSSIIYNFITPTVKHPLYNMHIGKMISRPLETLRMKAIYLYNLKKINPKTATIQPLKCG